MTTNLTFQKAENGFFSADYKTASDHDVIQMTLPKGCELVFYAQIPGSPMKTDIYVHHKNDKRNIIYVLNIPKGIQLTFIANAQLTNGIIMQGE